MTALPHTRPTSSQHLHPHAVTAALSPPSSALHFLDAFPSCFAGNDGRKPASSPPPPAAQALTGMSIGGRRTVRVPPELGFGGAAVGAPYAIVPAGSTLVYEVELLRLSATGPDQLTRVRTLAVWSGVLPAWCANSLVTARCLVARGAQWPQWWWRWRRGGGVSTHVGTALPTGVKEPSHACARGCRISGQHH